MKEQEKKQKGQALTADERPEKPVAFAVEDEHEGEHEIYTLVDEEGTEIEFEKIGEAEMNGVTYFAMIPVGVVDADGDGFCEYIVLRKEKDENGEDSLVTIDDDEEFDNIADFFDDQFSEEIDYDGSM